MNANPSTPLTPEPSPEHSAPVMSRRRLLARTGLGLVGAALVGGGAAVGVMEADPELVGAQVGSARSALAFRSRPDLTPPSIQISEVEPATGQELFFITPNLGPGGARSGQSGLMIVDGRGHPIWFQPLGGAFTNLQVQSLRGEPVLTWWQGTFDASAGFGRGEAVIADRSYRQIATIHAANGLQTDLHEFVLTEQGTALITAFATSNADLTALEGPKSGSVYQGVVQEIDVASGRLIFEWRSLDHIGVDESYAQLGGYPFDYFHVNSIAVDPDDGNLLVSARNTWAVYKLNRKTGDVIWRLGGKRSDFHMGKRTLFYWQHHARSHGSGLVTLFDDGASPQEETQSRALALRLDEIAMTATFSRAFTHPARLLAQNQGSFQLLTDGGGVVGWGSEPYFSRFDAAGRLERDGRMPTNNESYRAFASAWTATPSGAPDVAVEDDHVGGRTVYVSWNGATNVATWQVLTGSDPARLHASGSAPKAGFETAITVHTQNDFLAVRAMDRHGRALGTSPVIHL